MNTPSSPIPFPPPALPGQTAADRGRQLLLWTLATGVDVTLSTPEIHLALTAARAAVSGPVGLDTTRETLASTVSRLSAAERRRRAPETPRTSAPAGPAPRPNVGPMARLTPVAPTRPPAPVVRTPLDF